MELVARAFLAKASESLLGAEAELEAGRYNNCANRCYYACFQAAVAALRRGGISPPGEAEQWGHDFVQARFVGDLINRRHLYPVDFRDTFDRLYSLRQLTDYHADFVTETQAARALRRTRAFLHAVRPSKDPMI